MYFILCKSTSAMTRKKSINVFFSGWMISLGNEPGMFYAISKSILAIWPVTKIYNKFYNIGNKLHLCYFLHEGCMPILGTLLWCDHGQ